MPNFIADTFHLPPQTAAPVDHRAGVRNKSYAAEAARYIVAGLVFSNTAEGREYWVEVVARLHAKSTA